MVNKVDTCHPKADLPEASRTGCCTGRFVWTYLEASHFEAGRGRIHSSVEDGQG